MTHQQDRRGVPIGALRIPAVHAHAWQSLVRQILGKDAMRFRGVEWNEEEQEASSTSLLLVVHLQPCVCRALNDGHASLMEFLAQHDSAEYLPGVRRRKQMPTTVTKDEETCQFTFAEMFAGIGGFRLGLEPLGGKCVVSCEKSASAADIYRQHFGDTCLGDILDYHASDLPDFDMLTAGFPCQPFSNRGHQRGLEDHQERGHLYLELVRILDAKQPASFLFENVAGLVTMDGGSRGGRRVRGQVATITPGKVLERILAAFASCGYQVDWRIVNSRHFLPQQRERVYIVGTRLDLACGSFPWDDLSCRGGKDEVSSSLSTVRDILEPQDSCAVLASELNKDQWIKVQRLYAKKNLDVSRDGRIDLDGKAPTLISQYHRVGSFSTKYVFEEADGNPRNNDGGGLLRPRFFTPRECCRLMGFPESFQVPSLEQHGESRVAHFYQGIGNAVTPPVVTAIATRLLNMLEAVREEKEKKFR